MKQRLTVQRALMGMTALGGAVLITMLFFAQPKTPVSSAPATAVPITVVRPERKDLTRTITLPGDIQPYQEAAVYAKVSGYLKWINVDRGDHVKAGQPIAELEIPELEREYRRAEANMEMKEKTYGRDAEIRQTNRDLIPLEEVEKAQTDFAMAKAARDELKSKMDYATIRAPFDGVVTARYVHPGALIEAGTRGQSQSGAIVKVVDLSRLRVTVAVPETEVGWISRDTPVQLTTDARVGEIFNGTVTRYAKALDRGTRTMPTETEVVNSEDRLYPGMFAHVTFTLESLPQRLTVPRQAVRKTATGRQVWLVEGGVVKAVDVHTGYEDASMVEVTKGLEGTEQVIVEGFERVRLGEHVTARVARP